MSLASRLLGTRPWSPPQLEMPVVLTAADLKPLGTYRNVNWYASKYGELSERRRVVAEPMLPNGLARRVADGPDGEPQYKLFDAHPPGSYKAITTAPIRAAKPPAPPRPVDMTARVPLLAGSPGRVVPLRPPRELAFTGEATERLAPLGSVLRDQAGGLYAPGTPPAVGPRAIIDRLASKGVTLALTGHGGLLVTAKGGRLDDGVLAAIRAAERLLVGELSGEPIGCELAHVGPETPPAVTIVALDVAACAAHAKGELYP